MPSVLGQSGLLKRQHQDPTTAKDEVTIKRWVELADILNGKKTTTKKKRWAA